MNEYSLVLNAGSSSLKFCVYRAANAEWQLETRGQIDGIGTSPKFTAKNGQGEKIADERLDGRVTDARTALDSLAAWLRERHRGARVLAVGHRVVHGGARYAGPIVVTPQILEDLRTLIPLAPLHQPYNLAAIEAVVRAPAGRAAGRLLRHQLPPRPARRRLARSAAARDLRVRGAAVRVPRAVVRIHRVCPAESGAGDRRRTRDRRAPRQRREHVRAAEREEHRQHARIHRARRTLHGHPARRRRSRRDPLFVPGSQAVGQGRGNHPLQEIRLAGDLGDQQRHARSADEHASRPPGWPSTTSSTARRGRSAGSPPCWAASTRWSSPPASARTLPRSAAASAARRRGSASTSTRRPTRRTPRGFHDPAAASRRG